ncbi:Cyclic AMP receptor protein [Meiothermus luteus]|jgi:CRP-like cAMP-binding protein|uniref:Cyclic AMP receptor protein n=1 Tax=Meiothermus luteus TaxID=2026184 RepID=A0A399ED93_9DEIN|nr:Crp/Fnr family transcriptional regulator [Meiothermus luteus]RIH81908.1 Cyclic AMP receptor protein [Meiothermus luteus]RMH56931.1 MAG: Crp/Fnr family transcriptional regulator [Deinococcota bacterium]
MTPEFIASLPPEARAEAERVFHSFTARRGSYIYYPEDEAKTLYYVVDGWVRLFQLGPHEEEITLTVVGAGEIFGEGALLPEESYGAFAEPLVDSELLSASREDLQRLTSRFPEAQMAFVLLLSRRLRKAEERLRDLRFKEVLPRLAKALLSAMRPGAEGFEVTLSHQDLAHLAGSTRETITKVLGELAMEDAIELGYRRILILKPEVLRRVAL